jgi:hypothetical protein
MVIEVVKWSGAGKTHALNQHDPSWTFCGVFVGGKQIERLDGLTDFPTCLRCAGAVMKS